MVDSGAFSLQRKGGTLDIRDYMSYLEKGIALGLITTYVTLDEIPRRFNSPAELERSAERSYANHQIMRQAGFHPIPVFHMGERFYWLEKYFGDGEPYIGLSNNKKKFRKAHVQWLDECFTALTDRHGVPLVKTHGFGITAHQLLVRYPWTTCDSTTWAKSAGYGKIYVPRYRDGIPDYYKPPLGVVVSGVKQSNKSNEAMQYERMGPLRRPDVLVFLKECGLTISDVRNDDGARRKAIVHYYQQFEKHVEITDFRYRLRD